MLQSLLAECCKMRKIYSSFPKIANFVHFCIKQRNLHHFRLQISPRNTKVYQIGEIWQIYIFRILQHFATRLYNFYLFYDALFSCSSLFCLLYSHQSLGKHWSCLLIIEHMRIKFCQISEKYKAAKFCNRLNLPTTVKLSSLLTLP